MAPTFAETRDALHRIAEEVVSPARVKATGNEIALEATPGGFGTPSFPDGGSPGDENHEEPYLYVAPWSAPDPAPEWNAVGFAGAEAAWTDEAAALVFFRARRDAL